MNHEKGRAKHMSEWVRVEFRAKPPEGMVVTSGKTPLNGNIANKLLEAFGFDVVDGVKIIGMDAESIESKVKYVKVHAAENGEWMWTAYAGNNEKIATTGETYERNNHAQLMAMNLFPNADVQVDKGTAK